MRLMCKNKKPITMAYTHTNNTRRSHTPSATPMPAKPDASPTLNGFVIAAENPKQAAIMHTPKPTIVS